MVPKDRAVVSSSSGEEGVLSPGSLDNAVLPASMWVMGWTRGPGTHDLGEVCNSLWSSTVPRPPPCS